MGVFGVIPFTLFAISGSAPQTNDGALVGGKGLVASYTFDGGTLEIYDVSSKETLSDLVDRLGFVAEGEVKNLVDKYSNYYVAVMTIHVPTVLPQTDLDFLNSNCKTQFEKAKSLLHTSPKIEWSQLGISPSEVWRKKYDEGVGDCTSKIIDLVTGATNPSSDVNGVLVSMSYSGSDVFYPTSIVNSYAYPVSDQSYFVRTPTDLQFSPKSNVSKTVLAANKRWYVVTDTSTDLDGKIEPVNALTLANDSWLGVVKVLYNASDLVALIVLILFICLVLFIYLKLPIKEHFSSTQLIVYLCFGIVVGSIIAFLQGKRKTAILLLVSWLVLLAVAIL